jgi:hypothetical protein
VADHRIYPHGEFRELLPGLWVVRGQINAPLHRNMVVLRLTLDELLIHSAVALDEVGMKALEALGRPAYAIVPNAQHQMDVPFYKSRYPKLLMLCPTEARPDLKPTVAIDDTVENLLPRIGFTLHAVPGSKAKELVYELCVPLGRPNPDGQRYDLRTERHARDCHGANYESRPRRHQRLTRDSPHLPDAYGDGYAGAEEIYRRASEDTSVEGRHDLTRRTNHDQSRWCP